MMQLQRSVDTVGTSYVWRTRVAYLVVTCALWVSIWPLRDYPMAMRVVLGLAVLANVLFLFVAFAAPTADAFQLGEKVGRVVGYQTGYRDGFQEGAKPYGPLVRKSDDENT